jgi:CheY-like chemotaxis protein
MRDEGDVKTESGRIETRRILVVEPDAVYRVGLVELLLSRGFTPVACADVQGALKWLGRGSFVAIWSEYELDSPTLDGLEFLERARARFPRASLVLVSSSTNVAALEARAPRDSRVFTKTEAGPAIEFLMDRHGLGALHAADALAISQMA